MPETFLRHTFPRLFLLIHVPKMFYSNNPRFFVSVDCIIFGLVNGKLCLLLTKRRFEPEKGKWSVMGGFVQEDESVDDAARRVLRHLTGLEDIYMEQVHAFGAINRDPGERVISVAYYALLGPDEYNLELLEKARGRLDRNRQIATPRLRPPRNGQKRRSNSYAPNAHTNPSGSTCFRPCSH